MESRVARRGLKGTMNSGSPRIPGPADVRRAFARRYLADYVEATSRLTLHRWQRENLCPRLDELGKGRGKRFVIGAPPQYGKSILLTKRLPAKLLGNDPLLRIGITAYNVTHATRLAKATRHALLSDEHRRIFPDPDGWLPNPSAAEEYSTFARKRLNEAQPSVAAYGLNSGFTGNGVDVLLVDDPYASPDDAFSATVNESTWRWWDELAAPRLNEGTDVVCMFHRYHPTDLAGRLLATGEWEYLRFPAVADDAGDDPTRAWREPGELLSPIRSRAFVEAQRRKNPRVFAAQFQQAPRDEAGALFTREMFEVVPTRPRLGLWMRAVDPAGAVKQENDETATALCGIDADGSLVIADVTAWKRPWPQTRDGVWEGGRPYEPGATCVKDGLVQIVRRDRDFVEAAAEADLDGREATYLVGFAKKGMGLPMVDDLAQNPLVAHVPLYPVEEGRADKKQKGGGWGGKGFVGPIPPGGGPWDERFLGVLLAFRGDGTTDDDAIDAVSVAMILLRMVRGDLLEPTKRPTPGSHEYYDALAAANGD